jgi:hypothetical protein
MVARDNNYANESEADEDAATMREDAIASKHSCGAQLLKTLLAARLPVRVAGVAAAVLLHARSTPRRVRL